MSSTKTNLLFYEIPKLMKSVAILCLSLDIFIDGKMNVMYFRVIFMNFLDLFFVVHLCRCLTIIFLFYLFIFMS